MSQNEEMSMRDNLRNMFEELLPAVNPEKRFVILSIGCGDFFDCTDSKLINDIFAERRVSNFSYYGVDSSEKNIQTHISSGNKNNFYFLCKDAAQLNPADLGLEKNSVDLVILRHPRFELFCSSIKEWEKMPIDEMIEVFSSKPLREATPPFIIVPTAADFKSLEAKVTRELIGVFRKIIEATIPKFLAPTGKLFSTCYQKQEMAAVIYFSKQYCHEKYVMILDVSFPMHYPSRIEGEAHRIHYRDGFQVVLQHSPEKIMKQKPKYSCNCQRIFKKLATLVGYAQEEQASESTKIKDY